jgi:hypothetical protein
VQIMSDDTTAVGSFSPDDFQEGGLLDDKDVTITDAAIVSFDFRGHVDPPVCCLMIEMTPDADPDADTEVTPRQEYYTIGELSKFTPSADGKYYLAVRPGTHMGKRTKAALFLRKIREVGFEMARLAPPNGIKGLVGVRAHVNNFTTEKFMGRDGKEAGGKPIVLVTKLLETGAPTPAANAQAATTRKSRGGAKAATTDAPAATATAPTATAPTTAPAGGGPNLEVEVRATEIILGLLAEKGGSVSKTQVSTEMFKQIPAAEKSLRNAAIALVVSPWLSAADRPWSVEAGVLSLG